jgi:hypothetical protein
MPSHEVANNKRPAARILWKLRPSHLTGQPAFCYPGLRQKNLERGMSTTTVGAMNKMNLDDGDEGGSHLPSSAEPECRVTNEHLNRLWAQSIALRQQSLAVRAAAIEVRAMSRDLRLRQRAPAV